MAKTNHAYARNEETYGKKHAELKSDFAGLLERVVALEELTGILDERLTKLQALTDARV